MDFNSSNWTSRAPRTLQEAFGPYAATDASWDRDLRTWKEYCDDVAARSAQRSRVLLTGASLLAAAFAVVVLLFLSSFVTSAHAAVIPPDPTDMVKAWSAANDHCTGDQIDPDANPACAQRDQLSQVLLSVGYIQSYNDVWVGPLTLNVFCQTMYTAEALTNDNDRLQYLAHDLNAQIPLRLQFGLWNAPNVQALVRRRLPRAFSSWARLMKAAASLHAHDNDPSLTLIGDD